MTKLAIDGGTPVRASMLPYARQSIDEDDRLAVDSVLRSNWLTTGPKVKEFEAAVAHYTGATECVAVNTGTAALHAAVWAAASLPSSPGYVGVYQIAALFALRPYGIDASASVAYGTILQVLTLVLFIGSGLCVPLMIKLRSHQGC